MAFKKIVAASTIATFLLIVIGGLVRATKSGLGCGTDWPNCSGRLLPELANRAMVIEYSHRLVAGIVVVLLAAVAIQAFRTGQARGIRNASVGAFALVVFQALLGMIVVVLELEAVSVVLHLATALSLLALLLFIWLEVGESSDASDTRLAGHARVAGGAVLVLLLVGSYVSGRDAGYVFADWPLMDGRLIPTLAVELEVLHWLHRALAVVTGVILAITLAPAIRHKNEIPRAARFATVALVAFLAEVGVGAANVLTQGNSGFVTLHLALGALIWGNVVSLALVTRPRTSVAEDRSIRQVAVLESR
jgi:cytochrome c oxidase assembly protein subunit 15